MRELLAVSIALSIAAHIPENFKPPSTKELRMACERTCGAVCGAVRRGQLSESILQYSHRNFFKLVASQALVDVTRSPPINQVFLVRLVGINQAFLGYGAGRSCPQTSADRTSSRPSSATSTNVLGLRCAWLLWDQNTQVESRWKESRLCRERCLLQ